VYGTLWEATASDEAIQGNATPIVSNFNARARSGETYRALFQVATPQGVNPSTLAQGQKTTGKVYFDVTGDTPDSVVYNTGDQDVLIWVQPPPAPMVSPGGGSSPRSQSAPTSSGATAATTPTATPATVSAAPAPAGSQGTPLPTGSHGTPLPADAASTATPAPAATPAATPAPAGTSAPTSTPSIAGSQGTPVIPGTEGTPVETPQAPAVTGSAGTPVGPGTPGTVSTPTTTVVPVAPAS
jgi:hypothetical protein